MATKARPEWPKAAAPIAPEPKNKPKLSLVASNGVTAAALMGMTFAPIKYVVPGYIAEGLNLFAGAPKIGKSWMMMELALAVASGGEALGGVECEQGDVLYLALEDNLRRLQKRLHHMKVKEVPEGLTFMTEWPDLDHGCLPEVERWLQDTPTARLVIVDVFAKIKGSARAERPQYEVDYAAASGLQKLAGDYGVAVIVVHHTRKAEADDPFDTVSGTLGLPGAADTTLVLKRDAGGQHPTLYGRGRDIEQFEAAMQFEKETCRWRVMGDAAEIAKTSERQEILDALKDAGEPMTATAVSEVLGKNRSTTSHLLSRMVKEGKVERGEKNRYSPTAPTTPYTAYTHDPETGEIHGSEVAAVTMPVHKGDAPYTADGASDGDNRVRRVRCVRGSASSPATVINPALGKHHPIFVERDGTEDVFGDGV